MTYLRSLDEFSEKELREELAKRRKLRENGKCDYCGRGKKTRPCKFPDRHSA